MILSCSNICKSFHEKRILDRISFHLEENDKAALVGINGAGKTTLLRILVRELEADSGNVFLAKGSSLGYLQQNPMIADETTIYESLLKVKEPLLLLEEKIRRTEEQMHEASGEELTVLMEQYSRLTHAYESGGGYLFRSELTGVLKGLGFAEEEFHMPLGTLSGGQKTRVALGRLLLEKPDLIILDEPTNHLDMAAIAWLETYLLNYRGALLIVSHDRYFLDKIARKVIELDHGSSTIFTGNYSQYAVKKEALRKAAWKAYVKQQQEIRHQETVIEKLRSFNREKSIRRAESRQKALDKMERIDKPQDTDAEMKLSLHPEVTSGNDVLAVAGLTKSFDRKLLFSDLGFEIKRGEHVALIGDNGTGKTTLLKIIRQLLEADSGSLRFGSNVTVGYYDQAQQVLHDEKTLLEEISDEYPFLDNTRIRNTLAAFLFTGDDVFQKISSLSGGERGRVSLAKLMLSRSNFLILDEPTNHLDIISREILETALNHYEGTVLYVSHDRYFINRTAHRILELSGGTLTGYMGNYDYYLEKREQLASREASPAPASAAAPPAFAAKLEWKQRKEAQAIQRKRENDLKKLENQIQALENQISDIDRQMQLPEVCTDVARLQILQQEKETAEESLLSCMEQWETMA